MPGRRAFLLASLALAAPVRATVDYPAVVPRPLVFPRDHGAHPEYRTEWWYLTGWLDVPGASSLGFQVTFFRTRTEVDPANPSAFAAKQLVIAHAALADPALGSLLHDERIARTGFDVVGASEQDTDVRLGPWRFIRQPDRRLPLHAARARVLARIHRAPDAAAAAAGRRAAIRARDRRRRRPATTTRSRNSTCARN